MRRLGIAATLAAIVVFITGSASWAVEPPPVEPPGVPPTTVPEPPVNPDAIPPEASPTDPEAFLCELTGSLLDAIEENGGGAAAGPLKEQHAGFCSGGGGDEGPIPPEVLAALCPVLDQVQGGAGADPTGTIPGLVQTIKDTVGCPTTTTTTTPGGGGGNTNKPGGGGGGAPAATDPAVLGGGAGASGNGELPRTGGALPAVIGLGGTGLAGLTSLLRRLLSKRP